MTEDEAKALQRVLRAHNRWINTMRENQKRNHDPDRAERIRQHSADAILLRRALGTPLLQSSLLTKRQRETLAAYALVGDGKQAAEYMGVSYQTFKNHLMGIHQRLGVPSTLMALRRIGWLRVPTDLHRSIGDLREEGNDEESAISA